MGIKDSDILESLGLVIRSKGRLIMPSLSSIFNKLEYKRPGVVIPSFFIDSIIGSSFIRPSPLNVKGLGIENKLNLPLIGGIIDSYFVYLLALAIKLGDTKVLGIPLSILSPSNSLRGLLDIFLNPLNLDLLGVDSYLETLLFLA
jgi:hypothetical protein